MPEGCPKVGMGAIDVGQAVTNPVGTAIGLVTGSLFKTSAAGPNAAAAASVAGEVARGNLAAIKATYKRATYIQTASSAQPWKDLLATIPQDQVDVALVHPGIPEEWVMGVAPEQVLGLVRQFAVYPAGGSTPTGTRLGASGGATLGAGVGSSPIVMLAVAGAVLAVVLKPARRRR